MTVEAKQRRAEAQRQNALLLTEATRNLKAAVKIHGLAAELANFDVANGAVDSLADSLRDPKRRAALGERGAVAFSLAAATDDPAETLIRLPVAGATRETFDALTRAGFVRDLRLHNAYEFRGGGANAAVRDIVAKSGGELFALTSYARADAPIGKESRPQASASLDAPEAESSQETTPVDNPGDIIAPVGGSAVTPPSAEGVDEEEATPADSTRPDEDAANLLASAAGGDGSVGLPAEKNAADEAPVGAAPAQSCSDANADVSVDGDAPTAAFSADNANCGVPVIPASKAANSTVTSVFDGAASSPPAANQSAAAPLYIRAQTSGAAGAVKSNPRKAPQTDVESNPSATRAFRPNPSIPQFGPLTRYAGMSPKEPPPEIIPEFLKESARRRETVSAESVQTGSQHDSVWDSSSEKDVAMTSPATSPDPPTPNIS